MLFYIEYISPKFQLNAKSVQIMSRVAKELRGPSVTHIVLALAVGNKRESPVISHYFGGTNQFYGMPVSFSCLSAHITRSTVLP